MDPAGNLQEIDGLDTGSPRRFHSGKPLVPQFLERRPQNFLPAVARGCEENPRLRRLLSQRDPGSRLPKALFHPLQFTKHSAGVASRALADGREILAAAEQEFLCFRAAPQVARCPVFHSLQEDRSPEPAI